MLSLGKQAVDIVARLHTQYEYAGCYRTGGDKKRLYCYSLGGVAMDKP